MVAAIDFEGQDHILRALCSIWSSTSSGELCCLMTALVVSPVTNRKGDLVFPLQCQCWHHRWQRHLLLSNFLVQSNLYEEST